MQMLAGSVQSAASTVPSGVQQAVMYGDAGLQPQLAQQQGAMYLQSQAYGSMQQPMMQQQQPMMQQQQPMVQQQQPMMPHTVLPGTGLEMRARAITPCGAGMPQQDMSPLVPGAPGVFQAGQPHMANGAFALPAALPDAQLQQPQPGVQNSFATMW